MPCHNSPEAGNDLQSAAVLMSLSGLLCRGGWICFLAGQVTFPGEFVLRFWQMLCCPPREEGYLDQLQEGPSLQGSTFQNKQEPLWVWGSEGHCPSRPSLWFPVSLYCSPVPGILPFSFSISLRLCLVPASPFIRCLCYSLQLLIDLVIVSFVIRFLYTLEGTGLVLWRKEQFQE